MKTLNKLITIEIDNAYPIKFKYKQQFDTNSLYVPDSYWVWCSLVI